MAFVRVQYTSIGFRVRKSTDCKLASGGRSTYKGEENRPASPTGVGVDSRRPLQNPCSPIMMRLQNVRETHQLESDAEPAERSAGGAPRGGETVDRSDGFESHRMRIRIR